MLLRRDASTTHTRITRALLSAAVLVVAMATMAGLGSCSFFLIGVDQAPELLFDDEFGWFDEEDWNYGAEDGYGERMELIADRLQAYEWRQFIQTQPSFGGRLRIVLDWSMINGSAPASPVALGGESDFRVTVGQQETTVALTLFDGGVDALTILDRNDVVIAGPVTTPTMNATQGRMVIRFDPDGDDAQVDVSVPRLGLQLTAPIADSGWFSSTRVTFGLSGAIEDARALERVFIMRW